MSWAVNKPGGLTPVDKAGFVKRWTNSECPHSIPQVPFLGVHQYRTSSGPKFFEPIQLFWSRSLFNCFRPRLFLILCPAKICRISAMCRKSAPIRPLIRRRRDTRCPLDALDGYRHLMWLGSKISTLTDHRQSKKASSHTFDRIAADLLTASDRTSSYPHPFRSSLAVALSWRQCRRDSRSCVGKRSNDSAKCSLATRPPCIERLGKGSHQKLET